MEMQTQLLKNSARRVLDFALEAEADDFLQLIDLYMLQFAAWFKDLEDELQLEHDKIAKAKLKAVVSEVLALHQQILKRAEDSKTDVKQALSELHKRGNALKSYIDVRPDRISITGKREG